MSGGDSGSDLPADGDYKRVKAQLLEEQRGITLAPDSAELEKVDPVPLFDEAARQYRIENDLPDLTRDQALGRLGKENLRDYLTEQPLDYIGMSFRKVWRMWGSGVGEAMSSPLGALIQKLLVLAGLIALSGLFLDNPVIIIGAMLLSPIIGPIYGFAIYTALGMIRESLKCLGVLSALLLGVFLLSVMATFLIGSAMPLALTDEITSRLVANPIYTLVAVLLGFVAVLPYVLKLFLPASAGSSGLFLISAAGLLIVVGVVRDTFTIIETELKLHGYDESLIKG